jgi:uncharacterized protein (TIGR04551 family)
LAVGDSAHRIRVVASTAALLSLVAAGPAKATRFDDVFAVVGDSEASWWNVSGELRLRGSVLYNLDLDRGPTPSGEPLYPVPLGDPTGQTLTNADLRLRTDVGFLVPGGSLAMQLRVDVLDNMALGGDPAGVPTMTVTQLPPRDAAFRIKRAWGAVLTPLGVIAAGRMGSHWGLGMLTNGGECPDCNTGDAADRVAFVTSLFGHYWALAFDFSAIGPTTARNNGSSVDLDPADDVRTLTFAFLQALSDQARERKLDDGKTTAEYGAYVSYRWQDRDVPASYLPTAQIVELSPAQSVARGFQATAIDAWVRIQHPWFRLELEAAVLLGSIDQPSLIPGVLMRDAIESAQVGLAFESDVGPRDAVFGGGVDAGFASGDPAPGFGAFPSATGRAPQPGDLDGPQAVPPTDVRVDNFRFHPDYRVDRILFHEIIGTVTDAIYVRPHLRWRIAEIGPGVLVAELAATVSFAVEPASTPGGTRTLGIEIDPTIRYGSRDGFSAALDYAVLVPLQGLDNPALGLSAQPAQLLRLRLGYGF